MAVANGVAGSLFRFGDLTPEMLPVPLARDGEPIEPLMGYVVGKRCPGTVKAALAQAAQKRREAIQTALKANDDGELELAWRTYLTSALMALIPRGLTHTDADVLAGDDETALGILRHLGAWQDAEPAEGDGEAEEADPLTGAGSSQTSQVATQSDQGTS